MSGLSNLKFVQTKRQKGNSPQHARRHKLSNKLHEQIQMAKAVQAGTEFVPMKIRTIKDSVSGESRKVETPKRLKPWWWMGEQGKMCITVRYGARVLEVIEGRNAIEADNIAGVISTLEVLRAAVEAGELDARIDSVSSLVMKGFGKDAATSKRSTLKLPTRPN